MKDIEITDKEITIAFEGTNFGSAAMTMEGRRRFMAKTVMEYAAGFSAGSTITSILKNLGLLPNSTYSLKPPMHSIRWAYRTIFK